jgi:hypothetical protein
MTLSFILTGAIDNEQEAGSRGSNRSSATPKKRLLIGRSQVGDKLLPIATVGLRHDIFVLARWGAESVGGQA